MVKCEYCGKEIGLLAVKYTWLDKQNNRAMHDDCYEKYTNESRSSHIEIESEKKKKNIMKKDMKKYLAIGFGVGFFLGIYGFLRSPYIYQGKGWYGLFLVFFTCFIFGLVGMFFGYLYTKSRRKKQRLEADGKKLKWYQEDFSAKHNKYILMGLLVVLFITILIILISVYLF